MDFVAVDVETANADMSSICQIGVAAFEGSVLVDEWKSLVDPEDFFDPINVSIHGITEETVCGQPILPALVDELMAHLRGRIVVSHTHFDRVAIQQAARRYGLALPSCTWLDSARVARRTWSHCSSRGYGLHDLCQFLGYSFQHHDALEDAKAAGNIILAAVRDSGVPVSEWVTRVEGPVDPHAADGKALTREGNPDGALAGEVLVFTGALSLPRRETADLAASIGCEVAKGVRGRVKKCVNGVRRRPPRRRVVCPHRVL